MAVLTFISFAPLVERNTEVILQVLDIFDSENLKFKLRVK